jgi:hypothetical protein
LDLYVRTTRALATHVSVFFPKCGGKMRVAVEQCDEVEPLPDLPENATRGQKILLLCSEISDKDTLFFCSEISDEFEAAFFLPIIAKPW